MKTNKVKLESLVELSQERSDVGKQTQCSNMCKSNYPADLRLAEIGTGDAGNFFIFIIPARSPTNTGVGRYLEMFVMSNHRETS
jgi:hypothetical protein